MQELNLTLLQYIQMAQFVSLYRLIFEASKPPFRLLRNNSRQFPEKCMAFKSSLFHSSDSNVSTFTKIIFFSLLFYFFIIQALFPFVFLYASHLLKLHIYIYIYIYMQCLPPVLCWFRKRELQRLFSRYRYLFPERNATGPQNCPHIYSRG